MEEIARYALALEIPALALLIFTRRLELLPSAMLPLAILAAFYLVYGRDWGVDVRVSLVGNSLKVEDKLRLELEISSEVPGVFLFNALDDRGLVAEKPTVGALYVSHRGFASVEAIAGLPGRRRLPEVEWVFYPLHLSSPARGRAHVGATEVTPYLVPAKIKGLASSLGAPRAPGLLAGPRSTDFLEVREYRPGDPYKLINWKAYAKTGVLHINETLREGHSTIYIVLDASTSCRPDAVGHGASLALSIAHAAVEARIPVGLFVAPSGVSLPPTDSPAGLKLLREALMRLDLRPPIYRPMPPKADTYIYISCKPSPEYVERLCTKAKRVVAIEVAPIRGLFADLAKLFVGGTSKLLCADKLVWSPPLESPAKVLARL